VKANRTVIKHDDRSPEKPGEEQATVSNPHLFDSHKARDIIYCPTTTRPGCREVPDDDCSAVVIGGKLGYRKLYQCTHKKCPAHGSIAFSSNGIIPALSGHRTPKAPGEA